MSNLSEDLHIKPSLRLWAIYLTSSVLVLLFLGGFFLILPDHDLLIIGWRVLIVAVSCILFYQYLEHINISYHFNSIEIVAKSGVFAKKVSRIPINRITNYDFRASFIERILGIGNVLIDTPGGEGFELEIKTISSDNAERIMRFLAMFIAHQKIAVSGDNQALRGAVQQDLKAN